MYVGSVKLYFGAGREESCEMCRVEPGHDQRIVLILKSVVKLTGYFPEGTPEDFEGGKPPSDVRDTQGLPLYCVAMRLYANLLHKGVASTLIDYLGGVCTLRGKAILLGGRVSSLLSYRSKLGH